MLVAVTVTPLSVLVPRTLAQALAAIAEASTLACTRICVESETTTLVVPVFVWTVRCSRRPR